MAKELTREQSEELEVLIKRARIAQQITETYDQKRIDRLCQAVAWAITNKKNISKACRYGY